MTTYPQETLYASASGFGAPIAHVVPGSPAAQAGLEAGMHILSIDGEPLCDILDWYWYADAYEIELEVLTQHDCSALGGVRNDEANEAFTNSKTGADTTDTQTHTPHFLTLSREPGEGWGIEFSEVLFDGLRSCVNTCKFCFMKMLPKGMRRALYVRDDDHRLSFLHGNFVTLTNLADEDVERIIQMHLSPLNVSIHAIDARVREYLMGKNQARGIEALEQLLAAGIEFKAQIVLMPGINDGAVLDETLDWILRQPGIIATGIVPYGYTKYAAVQQGFDTTESARSVINQVEKLAPRVQLADEFFIKAWPGEILSYLPQASYYEGFPLIEDGIGMLRSFKDNASLKRVLSKLGLNTSEAAYTSSKPSLLCAKTAFVTGEAFAQVLKELLNQAAHDTTKVQDAVKEDEFLQQAQIIPIKNAFFGGNVDVAGLLTAEDVITQVAEASTSQHVTKLVLPAAMFNDEGLTLDNKTVKDIAAALNIEDTLTVGPNVID